MAQKQKARPKAPEKEKQSFLDFTDDPELRQYLKDIESGKRRCLDLKAVNPKPHASFEELLERLKDPNEREYFLMLMGSMRRFIRGSRRHKLNLVANEVQIAQNCRDLYHLCQLFTPEQYPGLHEIAAEIKKLLGEDFETLLISNQN